MRLTVPLERLISAPSGAMLPATMLPVTVAVPQLQMPPPALAELPEIVLPVTVAVPELEMPPPLLAELPERVLPVMVAVPHVVDAAAATRRVAREGAAGDGRRAVRCAFDCQRCSVPPP